MQTTIKNLQKQKTIEKRKLKLRNELIRQVCEKQVKALIKNKNIYRVELIGHIQAIGFDINNHPSYLHFEFTPIDEQITILKNWIKIIR